MKSVSELVSDLCDVVNYMTSLIPYNEARTHFLGIVNDTIDFLRHEHPGIDINKENNGLSEIHFLPVCTKCRTVINDTVNFEYLDNVPDDSDRVVIPREYRISPHKCDKCGAVFTSIIIPTQLPFEELRRK